MADAYKVEVNAEQFTQLLGKTSTLPRRLKTELRSKVKDAAAAAAADSIRTVQEPPLERGKHPRNKGLRRAIASNIKVVLMANNAKGAGVKIKASAAGLEGDRKKLVRAYDRAGGWRHPVFARIHKASKTASVLKAVGHKSEARALTRAQEKRRRAGATWVHQKGRPYFASVINKHKDAVAKAVDTALKEALESLK